jgi:invasion protein IalB
LGAPYFLHAVFEMRGRKFAALVVASAALTALAGSAVLAQSASSAAKHEPYLWLQLTFSPWTKICNKDAHPTSKRVCVTVSEGRSQNSERITVSVAVIEIDGEPRQLLRLIMPYEVALQHGPRLLVDRAQPATAAFVRCLPAVVPPGGCLSDYEATSDLVDRMKRGQLLTVQALNGNGQMISAQIELKDSAQAYEGPGTEPFAEQQKKLEDELRKRQPLRPN